VGWRCASGSVPRGLRMVMGGFRVPCSAFRVVCSGAAWGVQIRFTTARQRARLGARRVNAITERQAALMRNPERGTRNAEPHTRTTRRMPASAALLGPTSHYFYSQRLKLHYVDWGNPEKPPLLLIHGGRDHARNWDWVAEDLRRDFHIVAPDLRGHGDSQWAVGGSYAMVDYTLDV